MKCFCCKQLLFSRGDAPAAPSRDGRDGRRRGCIVEADRGHGERAARRRPEGRRAEERRRHGPRDAQACAGVVDGRERGRRVFCATAHASHCGQMGGNHGGREPGARRPRVVLLVLFERRDADEGRESARSKRRRRRQTGGLERSRGTHRCRKLQVGRLAPLGRENGQTGAAAGRVAQKVDEQGVAEWAHSCSGPCWSGENAGRVDNAQVFLLLAEPLASILGTVRATGQWRAAGYRCGCMGCTSRRALRRFRSSPFHRGRKCAR